MRTTAMEILTPPARSKLPSAALEGLQIAITSSSDRVLALPRRCVASQDAHAKGAPLLLARVSTVGREAAFLSWQLSSRAGKAWEAAAEEARVRAAQLYACVELLEGEDEGDWISVAAVARALLSCHDWDARDRIVLQWDSAAVLRAVGQALRVRHSATSVLFSVSGKGTMFYQPGDNSISVLALDGEGDMIESLEAGDVCMLVSVEGSADDACVIGQGDRTVDLRYSVPERCVTPITLTVSVCGAVLPGSRWTVEHGMLGNSAVLAGVAPERRVAFTDALADWLPGRLYSLLYRGSRDGMTPAAFHRPCDGKGPTLVLVRSSEGWVFGGHAGDSWSSACSNVDSEDAFLFSVTGPHTTAPVCFPVRPEKASKALFCSVNHGPCFFHGLYVMAGSWSPSEQCHDCWCEIGSYYENSIGEGDYSLTGSNEFVLSELEVYAITRV